MAEENAEQSEELEAGGEAQGKSAISKEDFDALKSDLEATKAKLSEAESRKLDPFDEQYLKILAAQEEEKGGSVSNKSGDDFDPDAASNAELLAHIEAKLASATAEKAGALEQKMEQLANFIAQRDARNDLRLTEQAHPDLTEKLKDTPYKERFYQQAKSNPNWGAEKVYKQVEMELAHEAREKAAADSDRAKRERAAMTERGGLPSSVTQRKDMTKEEAVEAAYNAVFGDKD